MSVQEQLSLLQLTEPMAPIASDELPLGPEWVYQLKWDGVRMLAEIKDNGSVQMHSRKLLSKNNVYPEIHHKLLEQAAALGPCLLDGEIVYWNGERPVFQKVLQRERAGGARQRPPVPMQADLAHPPSLEKTNPWDEHFGPRLPRLPDGHMLYILFDLLSEEGIDLRPLPYQERYNRLAEKLEGLPSDSIILIDMYTDGEALWRWVDEHGWEGIVSKRLSSPYRQGKKHRDWLKKKTALLLDVGIIGVKRREGRAASLVMSDQGCFIGSVSLGLDEAMRQALGDMLQLKRKDAPSWPMPFASLPAELKGEDIIWLPSPLPCRVTGLELTSAGLLRHPKLVAFGSGIGGKGADH